MAGERLVTAIKSAREPEGQRTELLFGRITRTTPLTVRIDGSGYDINSIDYELILSAMVRELILEVDTPTINVSRGSVEDTQVVTDVSVTNNRQRLTVFRNLQVGDRVRILRCGRGQRFYILERV